MNLHEFDTEMWLDDQGIFWSDYGKNVSGKYIGIDCPWCQDDQTQHMGIHRENKSINCWRCGVKGTILKLIMKTQRVDLRSALQVAQEYHAEVGDDIKINRKVREITLPGSGVCPPLHQKYLENRNFNVEELIRKFGIQFTGPISYYVNRIIIPVYHRKKLVSFTTRACDPLDMIKYKSLSNEESVASIKDCLYNLDATNGNSVIVCEGPTDVWRIGDGSVCIFGKSASDAQVRLLNKFKRVVILFDSDANPMGLAGKLSVHSSVEIIKLYSGDPGSMAEDDVKLLRKEIFGKIY